MWCPRCGQEFDRETAVCPGCGVPLVEMLVSVRPPKPRRTDRPDGPRMEFLLFFGSRDDLEEALSLLDAAGIPWECREQGGSGARRLTRSRGGAALYVDSRFTHRAMRLLRRYDEDFQTPFTDEELDAAIADYECDYGCEAEPEEPDEPVSPEGYRMVFVFLAVFGALAVLAAAAALLH